MAGVDEKSLKTQAQLDTEAVKQYNRKVKASLEREAKLYEKWQWKGNKLPPFNIEPMAYERHRLAGSGMSAEDRALRKQWVKDQVLSPNEPRNVPELKPRNPIRRAFAMPWDAVFKVLKPVIGEKNALTGRFLVPRFVFGYFTVCYAWYYLKYRGATWQAQQGWHSYGSRDLIYPGHPQWPEPEEKLPEEFNDKGFMKRSALVGDNLKTVRS